MRDQQRGHALLPIKARLRILLASFGEHRAKKLVVRRGFEVEFACIVDQAQEFDRKPFAEFLKRKFLLVLADDADFFILRILDVLPGQTSLA